MEQSPGILDRGPESWNPSPTDGGDVAADALRNGGGNEDIADWVYGDVPRPSKKSDEI